jgi:hypothetical protein
LKTVIFMAALVAISACGSETPTTPTPAPIATASLEVSGQGSFSTCSLLGDCLFNASVQNTGAGCATSTAIVARFFDANNVQVGSDIAMGAAGSLSARTIRPGEIVALTSLGLVPASTSANGKTYRLFPTWTNVRCP